MNAPTIAQSIVAQLTRTRTKPLTLEGGLTVQLKVLSLAALEDLQEKIKALSENENANPREQLLPIMRAAVEGLEDLTLDEIGGFLLEDMNAIAEAVMKVGK